MTDPSSTEGFGDPTLTEEYIESSFKENNYADKQSEDTSQPVEKTQSSEDTSESLIQLAEKTQPVEKPAEETQSLSDLK